MPESSVQQRKRRSRATKPPKVSHQEAPGHNGVQDHTARQPVRSKQVPSGQSTTVPNETAEEIESDLKLFWKAVNVIIGVTLLCLVAYKHAVYMHTLHENHLWFSEIKEVEREISFRTESGLYYSYYKQFLAAPSISQGLYELTHDNVTEHLRTINILARFNIYQEVLLGALYRTVPIIQQLFEPVYFYINSIFALHAVLVAALYVMTWLVSSSWIAGMLAVLFYMFNKEDTTRVEFTIPLRESFSLPFIWVQLALLTYYFRPQLSKLKQRFCVFGLFVSTFLYCITWQFNQFVVLLQAMALFGAQVLELVPHSKILRMYLVLAGSLLAVCVMQYFNTMILTGLAMSFIPAAIIVMALQNKLGSQRGYIMRPVATVLYICLVFGLTAAIGTAAKTVIEQDADEHIYKFVLTKFGLAPPAQDFNVRLYLCNGAFQFLDTSTYRRMTNKLAFPLYVAFHVLGLLCLIVTFFRQCRSQPSSEEVYKKTDSHATIPQHTHMFSERPTLAFHLIQAVFFGCMAIVTLRMKYLWTPYICMFAALLVSDKRVWTWLLKKCQVHSAVLVEIVRHVVTFGTIGVLLYTALPTALEELEDLREFHDPDTVELMDWIKSGTPSNAAFTGSMQLLAGVKLCTGRPLTNHPHFEDKVLRDRTKELYQMYGRRRPEDVHANMKKYNVSYLILEDSICKIPSNGCRLPDLIDVDNGMLPDSGHSEPGLKKSSVPRFCDAVRFAKDAYGRLFKSVFKNKTFRVYRVQV